MRLVPTGTCLAQSTQLILGTQTGAALTRREEERREQRVTDRDNMAVNKESDRAMFHLIKHALFVGGRGSRQRDLR